MKIKVIGTTVCERNGKKVQIVYGWDQDKMVFCGEANHYSNLEDLPPLLKRANDEVHAEIIVKEYFNQDSI